MITSLSNKEYNATKSDLKIDDSDLLYLGIGYGALIQKIDHIVTQEKMPLALVIMGPKGVGKKSLCQAIAAHILNIRPWLHHLLPTSFSPTISTKITSTNFTDLFQVHSQRACFFDSEHCSNHLQSEKFSILDRNAPNQCSQRNIESMNVEKKVCKKSNSNSKFSEEYFIADNTNASKNHGFLQNNFSDILPHYPQNLMDDSLDLSTQCSNNLEKNANASIENMVTQTFKKNRCISKIIPKESSVFFPDWVWDPLKIEQIQSFWEKDKKKLDSDPEYIVLQPGSGLEEVRRLRQKISHTRTNLGWRIVFLPEAESLSSACTNALLKWIESPPPRTFFLLTSSRTLPKTLESRCIVYTMAALGYEQFLIASQWEKYRKNYKEIMLSGLMSQRMNTDTLQECNYLHRNTDLCANGANFIQSLNFNESALVHDLKTDQMVKDTSISLDFFANKNLDEVLHLRKKNTLHSLNSLSEKLDLSSKNLLEFESTSCEKSVIIKSTQDSWFLESSCSLISQFDFDICQSLSEHRRPDFQQQFPFISQNAAENYSHVIFKERDPKDRLLFKISQGCLQSNQFWKNHISWVQEGWNIFYKCAKGDCLVSEKWLKIALILEDRLWEIVYIWARDMHFWAYEQGFLWLWDDFWKSTWSLVHDYKIYRTDLNTLLQTIFARMYGFFSENNLQPMPHNWESYF